MNLRLPALTPTVRRSCLISISLLALIILIGLLMTHQPASTPTNQGKVTTSGPTAPAGMAVVEITSAGFVPKTLYIQPGTEVVWVNEDVSPHLPAADPYGTHTDLPSLVAPRALGPKETYSFLFTKPSKVAYHDEVKPLLVGEVVVR